MEKNKNISNPSDPPLPGDHPTSASCTDTTDSDLRDILRFAGDISKSPMMDTVTRRTASTTDMRKVTRLTKSFTERLRLTYEKLKNDADTYNSTFASTDNMRFDNVAEQLHRTAYAMQPVADACRKARTRLSRTTDATCHTPASEHEACLENLLNAIDEFMKQLSEASAVCASVMSTEQFIRETPEELHYTYECNYNKFSSYIDCAADRLAENGCYHVDDPMSFDSEAFCHCRSRNEIIAMAFHKISREDFKRHVLSRELAQRDPSRPVELEPFELRVWGTKGMKHIKQTRWLIAHFHLLYTECRERKKIDAYDIAYFIVNRLDGTGLQKRPSMKEFHDYFARRYRESGQKLALPQYNALNAANTKLTMKVPPHREKGFASQKEFDDNIKRLLDTAYNDEDGK